MPTTFSFSNLSEAAQKLAIENVRKTPFYRFYVNDIVERYYRNVPYDDNFASVEDICSSVLEETFLPAGGIDIARFYVFAEDSGDIDRLLDLIFFEVEEGLDSILSIEVKGGSKSHKTSASVVLDQGVMVVADGKEYAKEEVEALFVQWLDAACAEVAEKTKRIFLDNMNNDDSVVKYIKKLDLSFDMNGALIV
jgi:hypothetical protein